jgi:hypothetical protein
LSAAGSAATFPASARTAFAGLMSVGVMAGRLRSGRSLWNIKMPVD